MTRRIGTVALLVGLGWVSAALAQSPLRVGARVSRPSAAPAISLMSKRVESVDWVDTPFEEVVDWLRAEGGGQVNIIPRWNAMGVESVDRDTTVNLTLVNTTVADVLREVIDQLSEDGEIGFRAARNKVTISTKSDFGRKLELRVYDATDIVFRVPDNGEEAPLIDLQQTGQSGGGGGGGGGSGRSVFGGGSGGGSSGSTQGGEQSEDELEEQLEELRDLIVKIIAPNTWADSGGGGRGQIEVFNNALIVLNTIEVHEQIAGLVSLGK